MANELPIGQFIAKLAQELNIHSTPNKLSGCELELITLVRNCQFLYDKTLADFKDAKKKSEAWEAIAKIFDVSAGEVQQRWRLLRESYTRNRRVKAENDATESATATIHFPFYDDLKFLEPFIHYRNRFSKLVKEEGTNDIKFVTLQKFIKIVKLFPVLYDFNCKGQLYLDEKKDAWDKIAKIFTWTTRECMMRWKNLRERYARERKNSENGSPIKWELYYDLMFLDDHVKRRNSYSSAFRKRENLDPATFNYITSSQSSNSNSMLAKEENEIEFLDISNEFSPAATPESNPEDALSFSGKESANGERDRERDRDRLLDNMNDTSSDLLLSNANKSGGTSTATDEDELFGQTIAAELKNISNVKKKMKVKAEIYKLFYEVCD